MLLPIVLLLASPGPIQQAEALPQKAAAVEQSGAVERNQTIKRQGTNRFVIKHPGPNRFVNPQQNGRLPGTPLFDKGIVVGRNPCLADGTCQPVCAEITAYVFSDGENPHFKYVTDCPNLDVPYRTERARHNVPQTEQQPDLRRTKN